MAYIAFFISSILMIIDSFCHFYPREYLDALQNLCPAIKLVGPDPSNGRLYIIDASTNNRNDVGFLRVGSGFDNIERRLKDMEQFGIDIQAISVAGPGIDTELLHVSPEITLKLARVINDSLSAIANKHPEKFLAVGEIPLALPEQAIEELHRIVNDLGVKGVQIYTTIQGKPLDSPEFRPFFREIARMNIPVFLHPTYPRPNERRSYETDYELQMMYVWPFETTLSISRIVFSGILEEYPNLKLVTHHAGAMVPFFNERIQAVYLQGRKGGIRDQAKIKRNPNEYFKMMFHDTAIYGSVPALNCAAAVFSAERLIYATDYPFGPQDGAYFLKTTKESVEKMNASEDEKRKIYSENASKLFGL